MNHNMMGEVDLQKLEATFFYFYYCYYYYYSFYFLGGERVEWYLCKPYQPSGVLVVMIQWGSANMVVSVKCQCVDETLNLLNR